MICKKCQTKMPNHYTKCPVCGYAKLVKEEHAPQPKQEEVELAENISPYVESGDIDDMVD